MMRRIAAAAILVAALSTGAAQARTFTVVGGTEGLPSAESPNAPGSIAVPVPFLTPPERPQQLSYDDLLELWHRAGDAYGVPWQVLAAINKIESDFGRNMGPSSANAVGWMQFLPSTWLRWGVDADGDGLADPWNATDAVYAAARYLAAAGAQLDLERALFAYNHASWYVDEVLSLAQLFGPFGFPRGTSLFSLEPGFGPGLRSDALERSLARARRSEARASGRVFALESKIERLAWAVLEVEQKAGDAALSDSAFRRVERRRAHLETARRAVERGLWRARARLGEVASQVTALESEGSIVTFARFAPSSGGYVFPVGGGPAQVSVSWSHHDYPAADIAAPEGFPLYALADSTVTAVLPEPVGLCGIGLKLQVSSGAVYTYCHLSYVDPDLGEGDRLAAGTPVGLVGSTGHTTGPHLHLALDPTVAYPQDQPWFQSFAGIAFTWQDAESPRKRTDSGSERVFAVLDVPVLSFER